MKHIIRYIIVASFIFLTFGTFNAQNSSLGSSRVSWSTSGNEILTHSVLGTTNAIPLNFITNNIQQAIIDVNGYVGIGTNLPHQKLHVVDGNILVSRTSDRADGSTNGSILFGDETCTNEPYGVWGIEYLDNEKDGFGLNFWKPYNANHTWFNYAMFLSDADGFVGLNTNHPQQRLHIVDGNILISRTSDRADGSTNGSIMFGSEASSDNARGEWAIEYVDNDSIGYGLNFWKVWSPVTQTGFNHALFLGNNGNIGIGTNKPLYKLSVNGTILAKEIRVNTDASYWPDYVFDKDYELMTLHEVKQFVTTNKHLPSVPSAAEIDGQDVSLGEMNNILLQKIEELTLYVIDLQEQINALKEAAGKE